MKIQTDMKRTFSTPSHAVMRTERSTLTKSFQQQYLPRTNNKNMIMKLSLVSALLVLLNLVVPSHIDAAHSQVRVRDPVHTALQECDVI
jgi:hypothetical protein